MYPAARHVMAIRQRKSGGDATVAPGIHASVICQRAEAMKLTKAGLYHYVESKEDLLFKIMSFALDWLDREVVESARRISDPTERLEWIIRRHGREMLEGGNAISIVAEEVLSLGSKHRRQIQARRQIYFDFVRDSIVATRAKGKMRNIDPTIATYCLFGMLLWLPRWYQRDGSLSTTDAVDDLISLFFRGLLA